MNLGRQISAEADVTAVTWIFDERKFSRRRILESTLSFVDSASPRGRRRVTVSIRIPVGRSVSAIIFACDPKASFGNFR